MSLDYEKAKRFISARMRKVMEEVGQEVESDMKQTCPVDTGFLRDNIGHELVDSGEDLVLRFWSNASYSHYVEYGTSRMAAQPFFRPAVAKIGHLFREKS